jgi:hypothetical protein
VPLLLFLILVILIAQLGFWDTFAAVLGGVAMIVLFVLLLLALAALALLTVLRRIRG